MLSFPTSSVCLTYRAYRAYQVCVTECVCVYDASERKDNLGAYTKRAAQRARKSTRSSRISLVPVSTLAYTFDSKTLYTGSCVSCAWKICPFCVCLFSPSLEPLSTLWLSHSQSACALTKMRTRALTHAQSAVALVVVHGLFLACRSVRVVQVGWMCVLLSLISVSLFTH